MNQKTKMEYDPLTEQIKRLLLRIPTLGKRFAQMYLWKPMMFNFMLVGATGTFLNWILYELIFRNILVIFWGGTFIAMVLTTFLVFVWNFTWNKRWSLKPDAQIMKMKRDELQQLKSKIERLLSERFDRKGNRM